jgi:hypothetical protein
MSQMPILALVLYIATRLWTARRAGKRDSDAIDQSMIELFARAGLHFAGRELSGEDAPSAMVH